MLAGILGKNRIYAQVLEKEIQVASLVSYVYGDDLISQKRGGTTNITVLTDLKH